MMLYNVLLASIKESFQLRRDLLLFRTPQYPCVYGDSLPEKKNKPSAYFFHVCFTTTNPKLHFFLY